MEAVKPTIKKEVANEEKIKSPIERERDEELNSEYLDKREVTISLVHNYSAYRKANMKVLGQRTETIGSSISSCRILSSSKGEVEAYFPALIGLSPSNSEFITKVKMWLSNIQFKVNNNDAKLNTSFLYNKKSDYLAIQAKEDKINEEFESLDRTDTVAIAAACKKKVEALNALESTKYKYGKPVNVEEYLIYRHCLLYADVAKDMALINEDNSLRFYIKDELKEAEKRRALIENKKRALRNFVELDASDAKFNDVFIAVVVYLGNNVHESILKDRVSKSAIIMDFINTQPDKFNKIFNDKNISMKAFIEKLIAKGELVRSEYNQQISTADGTFIGSNMNEAVAYFKNPNNADTKAVYENKLKLL